MASEKMGPGGLMAAFFDSGAYTPVMSAEGGAVAAFGMVGGQSVYAICQKGDAITAADVSLCCRVLDLAAKTGNPVVTFYDSPGAKLQDGLSSLTAAKDLAVAAAKVSGVVPQIAVVSGVCGASSAMAAANADLCIMTKDAQLFLTSPFLSAAAGDKLKGAGSAESAVKAGVVSYVAEDAEQAAKIAARLIMMLPQNNLSEAGAFEYNPASVAFPAPYNPVSAIQALADESSVLELFAGFGDGVTTCLATISGSVVGIAATNGKDSTLGRLCTAKLSRFVRLCDAYSIPVLTVVNSGGFAVSSTSDESGALREAARLAATYADATCAKICLLCGTTTGTLYTALGSADLTIAMQGSVTAPVLPTAAVTVLYKEEIEASGNPIEAETAARARKYEEEVASASALFTQGLADFVADASNVHSVVAAALDILSSKRAQRMPKKHGNMPL